MDITNSVLKRMKEKNIDGITLDINNCSKKLLVLTEAKYKKEKEKLLSLDDNTIILSEHEIDIKSNAEVFYSKSFRKDYAKISKSFYGNVSDKMKFIFITGTNGKTTTASFVSKVFEYFGTDVCIIGTRGCRYKTFYEDFSMTTPDPHVLHRLLKSVYELGCRIVVMETSAHAIYQEKLFGIKAEVAALTNIGRDHLDFFGTQEKYEEAKSMLFLNLYAKHFVFRNKYAYFAKNADKNAIYDYSYEDDDKNCSTDNKTHLPYIVIKNSALKNDLSLAFKVNLRGKIYLIENKNLVGKFNIENCVTAALCAIAFGLKEENVMNALNCLLPIPGRVEKIENDRGINIFVDFAHTPSAFEAVLKMLFGNGRLICVFGAGGDRDKGKRSEMGYVAGKYSDMVIITSDNPRSEKPLSIISDIENGVKKVTSEYVVCEDRKKAIEFAIKTARKGDTIIVAGKGEESYLEINGVKTPYSDKEQIQRVLKL